MRSSGAGGGPESAAAAHNFRAASVDLLHSGSQKYSVDSRYRGGGGDVSGYGDDSLYQAGTGAGSTENEYAYVWETNPDDAGRRLDCCDPMLPPQHAQHCPQRTQRGPLYASRQASLAPSGEYETTTTPGRAVLESSVPSACGQFA